MEFAVKHSGPPVDRPHRPFFDRPPGLVIDRLVGGLALIGLGLLIMLKPEVLPDFAWRRDHFLIAMIFYVIMFILPWPLYVLGAVQLYRSFE